MLEGGEGQAAAVWRQGAADPSWWLQSRESPAPRGGRDSVGGGGWVVVPEEGVHEAIACVYGGAWHVGGSWDSPFPFHQWLPTANTVACFAGGGCGAWTAAAVGAAVVVTVSALFSVRTLLPPVCRRLCVATAGARATPVASRLRPCRLKVGDGGDRVWPGVATVAGRPGVPT